jgi:hypothetical protein
VHGLIGQVLRTQKQLAAAAESYRRARQLAGQQFSAPNWAALQQCLHESGQFEEACAELRVGLAGLAETASQRQRVSSLLAQAEAWLAEVRRLEPVLRGGAEPATPQDMRSAAFILLTRRRFAEAQQWYARAFAAKPNLGANWRQQHLYYAAVAASRAAAADALPEAERAALRTAALGWLQADLTAMSQARKRQPALAAIVANHLARWLHDPDLSSVREATSLAALPAAESAAWQAFWTEASEALASLTGPVENELPAAPAQP